MGWKMSTHRGSLQKVTTDLTLSTKSGWEDVKVAIKSEVFKEKRQIIWTESPFSFQLCYMSLN